MDNDLLARYEQAQSIMQGPHTNHTSLNDAVFPHWIENSQCFWYLRETKSGKEFRLVHASEATNTLAFDHQTLARVLTDITGQKANPCHLPIVNVSMTLSPLQIHFQCAGDHWCYEPSSTHCAKEESITVQPGILSPNGKKTAFVREHNLWIRDQASGIERPLTEDGTKDYSYASTFLGIDTAVQVLWSPDSTRLLTVQLDTREVRSRPLISYVPQDGSLHPVLNELKAAYPGDEHVESYRLVSIDASTGLCYAADYSNLPYAQVGAAYYGFFTSGLGWWSPDNRHAFFIDLTRGSKEVRVVRWDTITGVTKVLFEESTSTYIRIAEDLCALPVFVPLPETDELIWFSERSGWAHLYLYDLNTGKLKHPITEGQWLVRGILHYDKQHRELLFQSAARDPNINPYYHDICKVNIDSGELSSIKHGCFDHVVYYPSHFCLILRTQMKVDYAGDKVNFMDDVYGTSPCGRYVVTTYSRVDTPPISVLIDRQGNEILTLETTDVSGLPANWHWPEPVMLKADDDQTDIYGVVFRPPGFSPDRSYPVVDFHVGMRTLSMMPTGSFINQNIATYYEMAALAALGFIVVGILGRGTPYRNKVFQDHNFGKPGKDDDLADHIAGLQQLAKRYPYMDLDRVGITGMESAEHAIYASLYHSGFYKVAVSHCFADPRFSVSLLDMYIGIVDQKTLLSTSGPEDCIKSFGGKLLLIHGVLTIGSEPMFRLVDALQKANKDFDMLCLPNLAAQITSYSRRRGWDYLVTHLQNVTPPHEFQLTTSEDLICERAGFNVAEDLAHVIKENSFDS